MGPYDPLTTNATSEEATILPPLPVQKYTNPEKSYNQPSEKHEASPPPLPIPKHTNLKVVLLALKHLLNCAEHGPVHTDGECCSPHLDGVNRVLAEMPVYDLEKTMLTAAAQRARRPTFVVRRGDD